MMWPPDAAMTDDGAMPGSVLAPDGDGMWELVCEDDDAPGSMEVRDVEGRLTTLGVGSPRCVRRPRMGAAGGSGRAARPLLADGVTPCPDDVGPGECVREDGDGVCLDRCLVRVPAGTVSDAGEAAAGVDLGGIRYAASVGVDPDLSVFGVESALPAELVAMDAAMGGGGAGGWASGLVFREFQCPVPVEEGTYGAVRPVLCQDGRGRAAHYLADHMTPCSEGSAGCELRMLVEPVQTMGDTAGGGMLSAGGDPSRSELERFGPGFRHVCEMSSGGYVASIGEGRVDVDGRVHHWEANDDWTPGAVDEIPGRWVPSAGRGDGLAHGHPVGGGAPPRTGWFEALIPSGDARMMWFEPFVAASNLTGASGRSAGLGSLMLEASGDFYADGRAVTRSGSGAGCDPDSGADCLFYAGEMRGRDPVTRMSYDETRATPYQVAERSTAFRLWRGVRTDRTAGTRNQHLVYGWPVLDLQDGESSLQQRTERMRDARVRSSQRLVGVPPGADHAEQVWVRPDGPLMLYGATRVGNGQGGGPKGGCLVEMNPPGGHFDESIGAMLPFRKVLDNRTQAWCVMPVDAKPASACVTAPR